MKSVWVNGLKPDAASEMRSDFGASASIRNRLELIIQDKIESRRRISGGVDQYDKASWAYLQSDAIGYERALNEIISLISSKSVE